MCRDNIYQYVYQNNTITTYFSNECSTYSNIHKRSDNILPDFQVRKNNNPGSSTENWSSLLFLSLFQDCCDTSSQKKPFFKNLPPNNIRVFFENFSPLVIHIFDKPSMTFKGAVSLLYVIF